MVMGWHFWFATILFLGAYALIVSEKIHKTIVAICGAAVMIAIGIVSQEEAFHSLDLGRGLECRLSADQYDGDDQHHETDRCF